MDERKHVQVQVSSESKQKPYELELWTTGSDGGPGVPSASASGSPEAEDGEHWSDSLIQVRMRNSDLRATWERLHTEFRRHRAFLEYMRADYEQSKDLGAVHFIVHLQQNPTVFI